MKRKFFSVSLMVFLMAFALLFATAFAHGSEETTQDTQENGYYEVHEFDEEHYRQRLLDTGWEEEWLEMWTGGEITFRNLYNQSRFSQAAQDIMMGYSVVPSGEVVAPQYMGPVHFDNNGVLNVAVLVGAFDDLASATAIDEMREMGIIVYEVYFSQQEIIDTIDRLSDMWEYARAAGASSWGQGVENGVSMWLDPYSPEQIAIFTQFLIDHDINPDIMIFSPAVTDEMREFRANAVVAATAQTADRIVLVGEVEVTRTGIAFSLENTTGEEFSYGAPWDLAYYYDGQWLPVPHLPGAGGMCWFGMGFMLQSGGIQQYRVSFEWHFGELSPGRYMFIKDGWLGEWDNDLPPTYVLVEFEVTETTPEALPPVDDEQEWAPMITVASHSDVTPTGMRIVVENVSVYDIDHRAQLIFIIPAEHATSEYRWEWWEYQLDMLPLEGEWEDYFIHGEGILPAGGTLEFEINWASVFGELPPGDYKIDLSLGGRAGPPHPTGWVFGDGLIAFTVE